MGFSTSNPPIRQAPVGVSQKSVVSPHYDIYCFLLATTETAAANSWCYQCQHGVANTGRFFV
jgi:hypothetical protein